MNGQNTQPRTWEQTQWDRSAGIRHAALAAGLDRVQKISKLNRRLVKKMQDGTLGTPTTEPEDDEDDDGVHVGDITINMPQTFEPPVVQPPTTHTPPRPPAEPVASTGISKALAAALIAASLLGGGGAGALLYSLARPIPKVTDTDTDTQYRIQLVDPDTKGQ